MNFRATTEADHEAIAELMTRVFGNESAALYHSRPHQYWKYWQPRAGWSEPRSYVLENGGKMLAHGCVWPMPVATRDRKWKGIYLIDWAADPAAPAGIGIVLLRRVAELGDAICAIGGSEMTRAIMPKIGFRAFNEMWTGARPLRPMAQILTHQSRNWKLAARLVRNTAWRWNPWPAPPRGWSAEATTARQIPAELWPRPDSDFAVGSRDAEVFDYLAQSPWAKCALFRLDRDRAPAGYFCLTLAGRQARVADLWLTSRSAEDWAAALLVAAREARRLWREAAEITASASLPWSQEGLKLAGFRAISKDAILFYSRDGFAGEATRFHLQMLDSDFSFLHGVGEEYRT
jgi:Acetyltransferase (GNAT) domain